MTAGRKLSTISVIVSAGLVLSVSSCKDGKDDGEGKGKAGWSQGWSKEQRLAWYQGGQGSRLLPWAWAKALEQKDNDKPFLDSAHMQSFRFLPLPESKAGLPIGFAIDEQPQPAGDDNLSYTKLRWYDKQGNNEQWLGLNCSACHTSQIDHGAESLTIDGGQGLVDFQLFIEAVDDALAATQSDSAKFERFAVKVLGTNDSPANRALLKTSLGQLLAFEKENARLNNTPMRYGYGRLDAVGHIFNKVSQLAVHGTTVRATPNPSDAPVNYPFLWDIYRQSRLQWNGIVKTSRIKLGEGYLDYGALSRNYAEVVGVFGDVAVKPLPDMHGFPSSIDVHNQDRLENVLRSLEAPKWPKSFGALDQAKVDAGKALFVQRKCIDCHTIEAAGDTIYEVKMTPITRDEKTQPDHIATDPWMACNALTYSSASGKLEGRPTSYVKGPPLGKTEPIVSLLTTTVVGGLLAKWKEIADTALDIFFGVEKLPKVTGARDVVSPAEAREARLEQCYKMKSPLFAYKGRPLDGIWATPPFLHNGSVPTLYDLLLAPKDRPATFNVGTRQYDPVKGGYVTAADAPGNSFAFTASGNGNSNGGHDYGASSLTEEERAALVEYMKSL